MLTIRLRFCLDDWKRGYWELETCSSAGRLLEVVTKGEEDEAGTYHAHVGRVYLKKK
jgi:hypothetical protein